MAMNKKTDYFILVPIKTYNIIELSPLSSQDKAMLFRLLFLILVKSNWDKKNNCYLPIWLNREYISKALGIGKTRASNLMKFLSELDIIVIRGGTGRKKKIIQVNTRFFVNYYY